MSNIDGFEIVSECLLNEGVGKVIKRYGANVSGSRYKAAKKDAFNELTQLKRAIANNEKALLNKNLTRVKKINLQKK